MGEMGGWAKTNPSWAEKKNSIADIWEEWGRHIWGKGVLGI